MDAQTLDCYKPKNKKILKLYDAAVENYRYRKYPDAIRDLKYIVESEPYYAEPAYVLGLIYYKEPYQNYLLALQYFQIAIGACPTLDVYLYNYVGKIFYEYGRYDSAVKYYEKFLEIPEKVKNDKDYDEAEAKLKKAKFLHQTLSNPVPFNPKPVEGISTKLDEYLPYITADNELAFFTRKTEIVLNKTAFAEGSVKFKEKFFISYRDSAGKFTEGVPLPEPFNLNNNEGGATLTIDNKHLYYTVCKNVKLKTLYYNCDICHSEFKDGEWTPIESISDKVNRIDTWESQPSISSDGKTLYFVSDREGGYGGYDIYKTYKLDSGGWSAPINLGKTINTAGNEKSPFIHTDSQTLYFSSDGHIGLGGYDIFFSKLKDDSTWTTPKNIGYPINSFADDIGFFVSTDGKTGYFSSNKLKGVGGYDLYAFDLYEAARPEKVLFLKGQLKDEITGDAVNAHLELKNAVTKHITEIPVDSINGKYVFAVVFRDNYLLTIKKDGYAYKSLFISKEDSIFEAPAKIDIDVKSIEVGQAYPLNDIYFETNSTELSEDSKSVIQSFATFLEENPTLAVAIHGHTDDVGNDNDNLKLSTNRAKAVYDYLIDLGIDSKRLSYKGFGETKPIASNQTKEGRAKNRRTEFVILKK